VDHGDKGLKRGEATGQVPNHHVRLNLSAIFFFHNKLALTSGTERNMGKLTAKAKDAPNLTTSREKTWHAPPPDFKDGWGFVIRHNQIFQFLLVMSGSPSVLAFKI